MQNFSCNRMSKTVAGREGGRRAGVEAAPGGLYTAQGARKYLTRDERQRVLAAAGAQPTESDLLALTLAWTGARVSEVLALTAQSLQLDTNVVAIRTLKRRRVVVREVPVPPALMAALDRQFGLADAQRDLDAASRRLWRFDRTTAWRHVKAAMAASGVVGRHACPRGLRHGFGVGTLQAGVPLTLVQRWLGHARLATTAIYAEVSGPEERAFADGFQRWSEASAA